MRPAKRSAAADTEEPHLVFVNWRDSRHPQAGGAELYCESVARLLVRRGFRVTLLTSRPSEAPVEERVAGVEVRRGGGTFTVYLFALIWLWRNRNAVDTVIDCQNGIPFFSPLVSRRLIPVVCLIFHVHQDQFSSYFRWPMDHFGRWLEGPVSRRIYGERSIAVISPSTRSDVRRRLKLRGPVYVVPCGAEPPTGTEPPHVTVRAPHPNIVCVGRLVPHKQMELLIREIPAVAAAHPDLTVSVVGSGPELEPLRRLADDLELSGRVLFHGQVSDEEREELMREAWLTVNPSAGEGWGLSVIEANAHGVPAVAFRVSGLQDSIVDGRTGWLTQAGAALGPTISSALVELADPIGAAEWSRRAQGWAAGFSWETTTTRLLDVIAEERMRLHRTQRLGSEQRQVSDVGCRVSIPAHLAETSTLTTRSRRTDVWVRSGDQVEALMPGTDESGVRLAMERLGLRDDAQIRVARPSDWLLGGVPLS